MLIVACVGLVYTVLLVPAVAVFRSYPGPSQTILPTSTAFVLVVLSVPSLSFATFVIQKRA